MWAYSYNWWEQYRHEGPSYGANLKQAHNWIEGNFRKAGGLIHIDVVSPKNCPLLCFLLSSSTSLGDGEESHASTNCLCLKV